MPMTVDEQLLTGLKGLQDLASEQAKQLKTQGERTEEAHKRLDEIGEMMKRQRREVAMPLYDPHMLKFEPTQKGFNDLMSRKVAGDQPVCELAREMQRANDELYIAERVWSGMKETGISAPNIKSTKLYSRFTGLRSELQKALDTATTGEGAEWVPTGMSAQLMEAIRLELLVAEQFMTVNPPTNPWEWPFETGRPVAQKVSQATATGNPYDSLTDASRAYYGQTPTQQRIFSAKKLRCLDVSSRELTEDSMIAIMPFLKDRIVYGISVGTEDALLNGDDSGAHIDEDVTEGGSDAKTLFKGLRQYAIADGTTVDLSTMTTSNLRKVTKAMGIRAKSPQNTIWVTSMAGYWAMLDNGDMLTLEKYGQNATLITGELGRFDNRPVIVSELFRTDLNASGINESGGSNVYTGVLCVDKRRFVIGRWPGLGVETERLKVTDQVLVIAFDRLDFKHVDDTSETAVGYGINIPS